MNFLDQCTAVITGASSGLGAEFARQLAPVANTLILVARRTDRLEALKSELQRPGLTIHCRSTDLADPKQMEELADWLATSGEAIDLLINNAGLGDHGAFDSSDWERVRRMIEVNIGALTRLCHALLPVMKKQPRAAILNVSSVASFLPIPQLAVYAATKAYVTSFSEALRSELRGTNVGVTTLCPGPVATEFGKVAQRPGEPDPVSAPDFVKAPQQQVVHEALFAVERDRPRVIPGWCAVLTVLLAAVTPMIVLRLVMNKRGQR